MLNESKVMLTADDVAELLDVKRSRAYSIIRQLNAELKSQGKLVLRGRVNRQYFLNKLSPP
ncbi:DNA-binding protein [uncultured Megasphaera sp.]|uniref:DNA-binding protein n=1 Tax=uncultured Megasphaera sp. TaxID=165188 RepID=UPI0025F71AE8|nr:DNA-binding protein [uncultured Megasphaera sp.]